MMTPDLILYNAALYSQGPIPFSEERPADSTRRPPLTALATAGNRITAMGDDDTILAMAGPETRVMNLDHRLVLPGFIDTHFHFYEWAVNLSSIDFAKTRDFAGMESAIREKAALLGPGHWILGQGFNESDWPENRMPDRLDLDLAAPDNPVCIWRCDLHLAVANSMALSLAGIDSTVPDPADGVIVRDGTGIPTGVLKEMAPNLIRNVVPALTFEQLLENMETAMARAHAMGLTGIHDIRLMGGEEGAVALRAWQALHAQGRLALRCHVTLPGEMTRQAIDLGLCTGFGDDLLRIGHLKFFSDGGMGARTAWMTEPYLDAADGMPLTPIKEIEQAVVHADAAGLSCMVHAVGDRAVHEVLTVFAKVEMLNRSACQIPHRIEHVQMILPEDLAALGRMKNLAVSCQPNNMSLDISMIDQCAGDRGRYAYNFKNILNTGIPTMFSSDAPVADPNPFSGIYSAVTRMRMNHTPDNGWYPDQCLTVDQAVQGYTSTPAAASGMRNLTGSLAVGKRADLIVTDRNIFTVDPKEIPATRVILTLFNGKIVYEKH
ncbi:MAG: amidohydrolase [Thermodesulfobacteriota bacterium]